MKVFIFEGLPGSGKTTMSVRLSKELNLKKIGEIIDENYKEVDSSKALGFKQSFYFENDKRKYQLAKRYSKSVNVLVDRGFLSTFAYNSCLDKKAYKSKRLAGIYDFFNKLSNKNVFYIFIEISPETSQKRKIQKKFKNNLWAYKSNLVKIRNFYKKEFKKSNLRVIFVDGERDYFTVYKEIKSKVSDLID